MGLERASAVGGDGIGVSGVATLEQNVATAAIAPNIFTQPLLVKNMPSLRVLFTPILNPVGATAVIQIAQRAGNVPGTQRWHTVQSVVIGGVAPILVEFKFPADFMRVGYAPAAAVATSIDIVLGCSI
jgi:hypothetical protein|tara:strand:+ start:151 stop:534 length:384 start_codon:yes stop_codon:yes gene_type:complete